jgi:hypothetical protein
MLTTPDRPSHRGYTIRQLHQCALRETKDRHRRYSNKVLTKRMTQAKADAEIDKMAAIGELLAELASKELLL